MDLLESSSYVEGIVSDAILILKRKALKKKKLKEEGFIAYLFTKEQVDLVLNVFKGEQINVWKDDEIYCLSRYDREDFPVK